MVLSEKFQVSDAALQAYVRQQEALDLPKQDVPDAPPQAPTVQNTSSNFHSQQHQRSATPEVIASRAAALLRSSMTSPEVQRQAASSLVLFGRASPSPPPPSHPRRPESGASSSRPPSRGSARPVTPNTVAVALHRLPRDDPVPDVLTSRRHICSHDDVIRIFVHVQGSGDCLSLTAHSELRLGPVPPDPCNRLTDVFGDVARGVSGRAAEFRERLLASKQARKLKQVSPSCEFTDIAKGADTRADAEEATLRPGAAHAAAAAAAKEKSPEREKASAATETPAKRRQPRDLSRKIAEAPLKIALSRNIAESVGHVDNLKDRLLLLTGIAPGEMRLIFRGSPMTIDGSTLREYGICHGETILLTKRDCPATHSHAAAAAAAAATSAWTVSAEVAQHKRWSTLATSPSVSPNKRCSPPSAGSRGAALRQETPRRRPGGKDGKGFRLIPRWQTLERGGEFNKERPMHLRTEAVYTFDYSAIQEHGHVDFCSFIRRLHGIT